MFGYKVSSDGYTANRRPYFSTLLTKWTTGGDSTTTWAFLRYSKTNSTQYINIQPTVNIFALGY